MSEVTLAIESNDKMYLKEHLGTGEATDPGDGRTFTLSRGLGLPALFVDVHDGDDTRRYLVRMTQDTVAAVLDHDAVLVREFE